MRARSATGDAERRTCATTDVSVKNVQVSWPTLLVRVTSHEERKGDKRLPREGFSAVFAIFAFIPFLEDR